MNRKYYIASGVKVPPKATLVIAFVFALLPSIRLLTGNFSVIDVFFYLLSGLLILIAKGKLRITGIELSDQGMKTNLFIFLRNYFTYSRLVPRFLHWDEMVGMITYNSCVHSFHGKEVAKIFINKQKRSLKYLLLESTMFEDADDLFEFLRNKIPNIMNNSSVFLDLIESAQNYSQSKFEDVTVAKEGLIYSQEIISWSRLKTIEYEDFNANINGYGSIRLHYQNNQAQLQCITIEPEGTVQFLQFLKHLIKNADKSSIDPTLLRLFDNSYFKERAFIKWFVIIVITLLIFFIGYFIWHIVMY